MHREASLSARKDLKPEMVLDSHISEQLQRKTARGLWWSSITSWMCQHTSSFCGVSSTQTGMRANCANIRFSWRSLEKHLSNLKSIDAPAYLEQNQLKQMNPDPQKIPRQKQVMGKSAKDLRCAPINMTPKPCVNVQLVDHLLKWTILVCPQLRIFTSQRAFTRPRACTSRQLLMQPCPHAKSPSRLNNALECL